MNSLFYFNIIYIILLKKSASNVHESYYFFVSFPCYNYVYVQNSMMSLPTLSITKMPATVVTCVVPPAEEKTCAKAADICVNGSFHSSVVHAVYLSPVES